MSRFFSVQDESWGAFSFFIIHTREDGSWEDDWDIFRTSDELLPISQYFTLASYDAYQDALRNYPMSLIKELGPKPSLCLLKQREPFVECSERLKCSMFNKKKCVGNKTPPICFTSNTSNKEASLLVARVYDLWRQGIYIVVAPKDELTKEFTE